MPKQGDGFAGPDVIVYSKEWYRLYYQKNRERIKEAQARYRLRRKEAAILSKIAEGAYSDTVLTEEERKTIASGGENRQKTDADYIAARKVLSRKLEALRIVEQDMRYEQKQEQDTPFRHAKDLPLDEQRPDVQARAEVEQLPYHIVCEIMEGYPEYLWEEEFILARKVAEKAGDK